MPVRSLARPATPSAGVDGFVPSAPVTRAEGLECLDLYLREIASTPLLTAQEERQLAQRIAQGDPAARAHLITANLRLVVAVARTCARLDQPLPDRIQNGTLGLMRAVERYDPAVGGRFSTYAVHWIRQAILREREQTARMIRLPSYVYVQLGVLERATDRWFQQSGSEPSAQQLATHLGWSLERVQTVRLARFSVLSLDGPLPTHPDATLAELLSDEGSTVGSTAVETQEERAEHHVRLYEALARLKPRELRAVILSYGLDGHEARSLAEVGERMQLSRERVRQLLVSAIQTLRRVFAETSQDAEERSRP